MFWRNPTVQPEPPVAERELLDFARSAIHDTGTRPSVGMVLGSGLGSLADNIKSPTIIDYTSIPNFPQPTAVGHAGRLVLGSWNDVDVAILQGRFHLYEGHDPETTLLPIRLLQAMGIETLILTNASGGMNPEFEAGDLMVIEDHVNLMPFHVKPASSTNWPVYDLELIQRAKSIDAGHTLRLHAGVYVGVPGPNYETPAEYRMFRQLGGDTVGMSTVLEAVFARQLGLRVCGVSVITNVYRPDVQHETTGEEVVDVATSAAERMSKLISALLLSRG